MKRKILISFVIVSVLTGAGLIWLRPWETEMTKYESFTVARQDLRQILLSTAIVQPQNRLEIKPPIAGRAEAILVREGQRVKKGQVLAFLSSTERAAVLDSARARGPEELRRWREIYRPTPLIAPIAGEIISRRVEPGQTVGTGDAVLVMSDRLILRASVDETDIGQIKVGQRAGVQLDAYPDEAIEGTVDHVAFEATTTNNVTSYQVEVVPDRVPAVMKSGMTANIRFHIAVKNGALVLPVTAVRQEEKVSFVLRSSGEGKPSRSSVQVGISDGKFVEIVSGLNEGDRVVVAAPDFKARGDKPSNPFGPPQIGRGGRSGGGGAGRRRD